jgi:zinc D-Ala-D-Ala carboxypeptidase
MELSTHFSVEEATASEIASRNGIDNSIPPALMGTVYKTATCMERIRALLGNIPLHINSWYRCPELNSAVGSKSTSQHLRGEAVDFICPQYGTPYDICQRLIDNKDLIRYDQLIFEHTWVHISFGPMNRGEVLTLMPGNTYTKGLVQR